MALALGRYPTSALNRGRLKIMSSSLEKDKQALSTNQSHARTRDGRNLPGHAKRFVTVKPGPGAKVEYFS